MIRLFLLLVTVGFVNLASARELEVTSELRDDLGTIDERDALEAKAYTEAFEGEARSEKIRFSRACEAGRHFVIGAVGDVLLHQALAVQGMSRREGYRSLWAEIEPEMKRPTFMYANLEGPAAGPVSSAGRPVADPGAHFDKVAYTSYPMFNYRPDLVNDLVESGVDVVSTANNHSLDRRALGVDRTIEALLRAGLPYTGTRSVAETLKNPPEKTDWSTVTEKDGLRVAWVACTFSTNGIPDKNLQVLQCFEQRAIVLAEIRRLRADPTIDAVIATPHWGLEYEHVPGADQKRLAREMVDAGAMIVFGNHPHVLQPIERITAKDGHEGYVIYSLGNFVSGQKGVAKRTTALITVGLTKNARGEVFVNGARHLPLAMMYGDDGLMVRPAKGNFEEARLLANQLLAGSTEIAPGEPLVTNLGCR